MREFRILFVLLPAMFLLGCDKDFHPGLGKPQEVEVTLASLAVADAVVVEPMGSRSAAVSADDGGGLFTVGLGSGKGVDAPAGGSVSSRADMGLSNVWVLQFDAAGKTKACAYVGTVAAGQKVKAALQSGEGYTVWIVANGPAAGGFTTSNPASLSDFESGMLHTAVPASDGLIPLSGKLTGVRILDNGQVLVGGDNAIVPEVTLSRAMARVDVLLEYDVSGAVLDGVWLYQVPAGACYGLDGSVTNYPASDVESNFLYRDGMSAGQAPASSGSGTVTHTWYIGDNRRGENASILWEKNKGEKNAPKMAAYARIKSHEAGDVNKGLFHDVYLGDNVTTNFDVLRNRHYIYRVRIGGTLDQQKALALTDDRVWAGMLEYLEGAPTITPSLDEEIPLGGRTFTVRFNGYWTGAGIPVRARVGEQALAEAKAVCQDGTGEATLAIPANDGPQRSIMFEYQWKGQWIPVGAGTQEAYQPVVGNLYGGGVVYWGNPKDAEDFRVVAMDQTSNTKKWAINPSFVLGSGAQDENAFNGSEVWKIAKQYSDSRTGGATDNFATDFPAFDYCYNKTDGGVAKGTWYLPSIAELSELRNARARVESVIIDNGGMAFSGIYYWSATEHSSRIDGAWDVNFSNGTRNYGHKTDSNYVRCVREK